MDIDPDSEQPRGDWPAGGVHSSTISDRMSGPPYGPTGFVDFSAAVSVPMSPLLQGTTGFGGLGDLGDLGDFNVEEWVSEQILFPVQLLLDRPDVGPSKRWNLLDQLMPLYSRQPKIHSGDFPTMRLMPEHYDSLTKYPQGPCQRQFLLKMMRNLQITTIPKEVMQTHRNRGVLIQPLEPDDSDDEPLLKRKLHNKYQLRFVNKVCEAYYTLEQIKADDGNLLNVALYDENNSKITSGPLSSASVEVVVLHGDFNANGQDYWTSEEFSSCVVLPQSGKRRSVLEGDRDLVLVDGEASVGYAFFQETSSFARTGKFKMGVKMKITIEERIQEGISESFFVTSRRGKDHPSTMDRVLKDPPAVIPRHAPVHELKLVTTGGAQFVCAGCLEPGCGPRYTCETCCNRDFHTWCALTPVTRTQPLYPEPLALEQRVHKRVPDVRRLCDASGDRVRGFLYRCTGDLDIIIERCIERVPDVHA